MKRWEDCKNILVIRLDNMGDLLMSAPAITALKKTFNSKITVLTSSMAKGIAPFIPAIDDVIIYDVPWVKRNHQSSPEESFFEIIKTIKSRQFDAAVIFTVFSQNPQPAAMLAYLANIPKRIAYCRENPYELLTHWVPDEEPYTFIRHQVTRDLHLVKTVGASINDNRISIHVNDNKWPALQTTIKNTGVDLDKPWLIIHPGVSEKKREYPAEHWIETGKLVIKKLGYQVLLTGSASEKALTDYLQQSIGEGAFSLAGTCNVEEFILLIKNAPLVISVNTATIHIAAATQTKTITLYALTNPQHSPWKSIGKVLPFSVPESLQSKNEVLRFLQNTYFRTEAPIPSAQDVFQAAYDILELNCLDEVPELVTSVECEVSFKEGKTLKVES